MNCAPCITRLFSGHLACPVPEKGVSGTEYPFRTVEAYFLHRMPQKMRRVPEEACFLHGAHIPYRRRPSPVPNSANARKEESIACTECFKRQKGERYCLHRIYQTARKEKGMARNMTRNAAASKKITASVPKTQTPSITSLSPQLHTQPPASTVTSPATTATHSANKKHHQYKTPPASTVTPPGCPKSPLLKVQSAFWAILAGVELTEGVLFGQAPPRAQKRSPD